MEEINWMYLEDTRKSFDVKPDDFIYSKYLEYLATGEYPYYQSVTDYICKDKGFTYEQERLVYHQVGLCSDFHTKLKEEEEKNRLLSEGWNILTKENFVHQGKILARVPYDTIIGSGIKEDTFKTIIDAAGNYFLLKPKATRNGICVNTRLRGFESPVFFKTL